MRRPLSPRPVEAGASKPAPAARHPSRTLGMTSNRSREERRRILGRAPLHAARLAVALFAFGALLPAAGAAGGGRARTLVIALDCVPYGVVADLTDPGLGEEALFRGFQGPVALVSTFPSSTSVAMPGILGPLGLERSPGYEARFFNWEERRVAGGGPVSYFRWDFPWREFFDWKRHNLLHTMAAALRPVKASVAGLADAVDAFLASDDELFLVYIGSTDTAAHLKSPQSLREVLRGLDRILGEARARHPERPFHTVLFSDHGVAGGAPLVNVWPAVRKGLRGAGLRYSRQLERPTDVALTPFGLVSSFEAYTWKGREAEVAALLGRTPGVDLCVYREDGGWAVDGAPGLARIHRREVGGTDEWRYEPVGGDPLGYLGFLAALRRRTGRPEAVWFADRLWFEATAEATFPDALYRIAQSFTLIDNPASVICSVAPGHMFGARKTEQGARLKGQRLAWTHGALEREATLGFLLADVPGWRAPRVARFDGSLPGYGGPAVVARAGSPGTRLAQVSSPEKKR